MNKRILFLALIQIIFFAKTSFSQPCSSPASLCIDQHVRNGSASWYRSHGTLFFSSNNAPTSPATTKSLSLYSYLNMGNGAFTCYNFQSGHKYRVCFWVRNASGYPGNPYGRLYVAATNGLDSANGSMTIPHPTAQMINQSYWGPEQQSMNMSGVSPWEFITDTFTAKQNFNNLWIYPKNPMGPPPPGPPQYNTEYVVEVDDIRVIEEPVSPPAPFISGTSTISGCSDQTTLTINNMPSNTIATWTATPASTITAVTADKATVIAKPCVTTTYKVEIVDTNGNCGNCTRKVVYYTVNVNQWSDTSRIIRPTTVVPCTTPINLDYNSPGTCPNISYKWISPQDSVYTGKTQSITATAFHTGEWTLQVVNGNKGGCAEEHKFNITVGSCCISNPNFVFSGGPSGCNPITFTSVGSGITNHIATLWNFGDGTTSDLPNPIHSYDSAGTYTVCLTTLYEDGQGESCCNRVCKTVKACANTNTCMVTANFNYAPAGPPNTFNFTDASSGNGTICKYYWTFGDGTFATTTIPTISHSYTSTGPWNVCLTATNCVYDGDGGLLDSCSNKRCKMITGPKPAPEDQSQPVFKTENELTISPNPNYGNFSVSLLNRKGNYQVVVRDRLGRNIYDRKHGFSGAPVMITLNDVADGVYSVEVINDNERFVQLITVTK